MKLQDRLPQGVEVDGKFYKMDFDFRNVFRMIEILDRDDLLPSAKEYKALRCLCKRPKNTFKVLGAVWTEEPGKLRSIGSHRVGHN